MRILNNQYILHNLTPLQCKRQNAQHIRDQTIHYTLIHSDKMGKLEGRLLTSINYKLPINIHNTKLKGGRFYTKTSQLSKKKLELLSTQQSPTAFRKQTNTTFQKTNYIKYASCCLNTSDNRSNSETLHAREHTRSFFLN